MGMGFDATLGMMNNLAGLQAYNNATTSWLNNAAASNAANTAYGMAISQPTPQGYGMVGGYPSFGEPTGGGSVSDPSGGLSGGGWGGDPYASSSGSSGGGDSALSEHIKAGYDPGSGTYNDPWGGGAFAGGYGSGSMFDPSIYGGGTFNGGGFGGDPYAGAGGPGGGSSTITEPTLGGTQGGGWSGWPDPTLGYTPEPIAGIPGAMPDPMRQLGYDPNAPLQNGFGYPGQGPGTQPSEMFNTNIYSPSIMPGQQGPGGSNIFDGGGFHVDEYGYVVPNSGGGGGERGGVQQGGGGTPPTFGGAGSIFDPGGFTQGYQNQDPFQFSQNQGGFGSEFIPAGGGAGGDRQGLVDTGGGNSAWGNKAWGQAWPQMPNQGAVGWNDPGLGIDSSYHGGYGGSAGTDAGFDARFGNLPPAIDATPAGINQGITDLQNLLNTMPAQQPQGIPLPGIPQGGWQVGNSPEPPITPAAPTGRELLQQGAGWVPQGQTPPAVQNEWLGNRINQGMYDIGNMQPGYSQGLGAQDALRNSMTNTLMNQGMGSQNTLQPQDQNLPSYFDVFGGSGAGG